MHASRFREVRMATVPVSTTGSKITLLAPILVGGAIAGLLDIVQFGMGATVVPGKPGIAPDAAPETRMYGDVQLNPGE